MQAESGWELQRVVAVIVSGRHVSAAVTGREIQNIGDIWRWPSVSMESTWTGSTTWLRVWFGLNFLKCFSVGIRERDPRLVDEPYGPQEELYGSIHGFPELILLTQIYTNWNEKAPSQDPNQVLAGPRKNSASNKGLSLLVKPSPWIACTSRWSRTVHILAYQASVSWPYVCVYI